MMSVLVVMQPGRTVETMPHLPIATLQQLWNVMPFDMMGGHAGSGAAGGSQPVAYIGFVLFAPHTCAAPTVAQHG
jgi:hypothetical protein